MQSVANTGRAISCSLERVRSRKLIATTQSAKLVLNLNLELVCAMLQMNDKGGNPPTMIADRLNGLLVRMRR